MKDLYTFDSTPDLAMQTYRYVQRVYSEFFNEFNIPYLVADASSGTIGGTVSHEYHFPSESGEDEIVTCTDCGYTANAELAESAIDIPGDSQNTRLSSVRSDNLAGYSLNVDECNRTPMTWPIRYPFGPALQAAGSPWSMCSIHPLQHVATKLRKPLKRSMCTRSSE